MWIGIGQSLDDRRPKEWGRARRRRPARRPAAACSQRATSGSETGHLLIVVALTAARRGPVRTRTMSPLPTMQPCAASVRSSSATVIQVAGLDEVDAQSAGHVEQHAAPGDAVLQGHHRVARARRCSSRRGRDGRCTSGRPGRRGRGRPGGWRPCRGRRCRYSRWTPPGLDARGTQGSSPAMTM